MRCESTAAGERGLSRGCGGGLSRGNERLSDTGGGGALPAADAGALPAGRGHYRQQCGDGLLQASSAPAPRVPAPGGSDP